MKNLTENSLIPIKNVCFTETIQTSKFNFDGLTTEQRSEVLGVITEFSDTFSDNPGQTTVTKHKICLESVSRPIKLPTYRVSNEKSQIIKKELDEMIKLGTKF